MDDKELSALFADVAEHMYSVAQKVLDEAQNLLDDVSIKLSEWHDLHEPGGSEIITPQQKYQYLLSHSNEQEKAAYGPEHIKHFLLVENESLLDALYESKRAEVEEDDVDVDSMWKKLTDDLFKNE